MVSEKIVQWNKEIVATTELFKDRFQHLEEREMNLKPTSGAWSIAQHIDHLIIINNSYFPILEKMQCEGYRPPVLARISFLHHFFGKMILKSVQPETLKKTRTFPVWEPGTTQVGNDILHRFEVNQQALAAKIEQSRALLESRAILHSPASKYIFYPLETTFDILIVHEKRHFLQAEKLLEDIRKTKPVSI